MDAPRLLGNNGILPGTEAERDLLGLRKRYPRFDEDLAREAAALRERACLPPDNPIRGTDRRVFKRRARCSDSNEGKSGGYRFIYGVFPEGLAFLRLYHKREKQDLDVKDLLRALATTQTRLQLPLQ